VPELAQDNNAVLTVYGYDERGEPVLTRNGTWGIRVPCRKNTAKPTRQIFTRIERVTKDPTYGFINLWAVNPFALQAAPHAYYIEGRPPAQTRSPASLALAGGVMLDPSVSVPAVRDPPAGSQWPQVQFLALYWPQDTEPMYRQIRIGTLCKRIRIRYRKNYLKITDLTDPIHVRNRTAVVLAMTGLAAMKQGGGGGSISPFQPTAGVQIAADQLNMAVDMLNDEWRVMHPQESIQLQWDRRVYGNAFPQIL